MCKQEAKNTLPSHQKKQNAARTIFRKAAIAIAAAQIILLAIYFTGELQVGLFKTVTPYLTLGIQYLSTFSTIFLGIFIEALPYLLLGIIASGFLEVFVKREALMRHLPSNRFVGVFLGSLMGLLFPVCEHGVVPLTRRLFQKGLPVSMGISFLLAAPVMNPIVIASTFAAFGWSPIFWGRIILSLGIAILVGIIFTFQKDTDILLELPKELIHGCAHCEASVETSLSFKEKLAQAAVISGEEFFDIGLFFVIGALLAALLQTFVPQNTLIALGSGPLLSILIMIALAVILSICSTVDAFVALSFVANFSTGSILAFLVYGPMIDIKALMMFTRVFKKKTIVYLALIPLFLVILATLFINFRLTI